MQIHTAGHAAQVVSNAPADRSDPTAPTPKLPWHPPELFLLGSSGSRSNTRGYYPTETTLHSHFGRTSTYAQLGPS